MAKFIVQNNILRKEYRQVIADKIAKEVKNEEEYEKRMAKIRKGNRGEFKVRFSLWSNLSHKYKIMNSVVLEITPGYYNEFDHIVFATQGIFLLDTKNWKDDCIFDSEQGWKPSNERNTRFKDPLVQAKQHEENFYAWLKENIDEHEAVKKYIKAYVIYLDGEIEKNNCDCVIKNGKDAASRVKTFPGAKNIPPEVLEKVISAVKNAKPLDHWEWIKSHLKFNDSRIVKVIGTFENTLLIKKIYESREFKVGSIRANGDGIWEFDILNHVDYVEGKMSELYKQLRSYRYPILRAYFTPKLIWRYFITFVLISMIYISRNFILQVPDKIESAINNAKESVSTMSTSTQQTSAIQQNELSALTFEVTKDYTYFYIKGIFEEKCYKGTELKICKDKRIIAKIKKNVDGEIKEYIKEFKIPTDEIGIGVANENTKIMYEGKEMKRERCTLYYNFLSNSLNKARYKDQTSY